MMRGRHGSFLRQNWKLVGVFLGAMILLLWFGVRIALDSWYFNNPSNVDVDLKPWMTPRYIGMTYDLPRPFVIDMLDLDPEGNAKVRLGRLAAERGMTMDELTAFVRDAAAQYRETQP